MFFELMAGFSTGVEIAFVSFKIPCFMLLILSLLTVEVGEIDSTSLNIGVVRFCRICSFELFSILMFFIKFSFSSSLSIFCKILDAFVLVKFGVV